MEKKKSTERIEKVISKPLKAVVLMYLYRHIKKTRKIQKVESPFTFKFPVIRNSTVHKIFFN